MKSHFSIHKIVLLQLAFVGMLITGRMVYSGQYRFVFLIWNLFLAWLPFIISLSFNKINKAAVWKQAMAFCIWLLFFPNALYIITDLIHLKATAKVPLWYDALILFAAALTGLIMAFVSLYKTEMFLLTHFRQRVVNVQVVFILLLGSFGVYLGRFLRWNSWDVVTNPVGLFYEIVHRFVFPFQHGRTWGITFILTVFLYLLWLGVKKIPGLNNRVSVV